MSGWKEEESCTSELFCVLGRGLPSPKTQNHSRYFSHSEVCFTVKDKLSSMSSAVSQYHLDIYNV